MQDEQIEDLKQFISATVSQTEERLRTEIGGRVDNLETKLDRLEKKLDDGFAGVAEAIETLHHQLEERDHVTDRRLRALEQRAA